MSCFINAWIPILSATRLQVVLGYSRQRWKKKALKFDRPKRTSVLRAIFVTLRTNCKHMEYQSLISTRKTTGNTTSTLTLVEFSISWSRMYVLSNIRRDVISNWKLWTIKKRQPRFRIIRNIANVPIYTFALHNKFCLLKKKKKKKKSAKI